MGFDLKSETGAESQWTAVYWKLMLETAERYGWKPAGTAPPEGVPAAEWNGTYVTNDGQLVAGDDASALAGALLEAERSSELEQVSNEVYAAYLRAAEVEIERMLGGLAFPPALPPERESVGPFMRLARALGLARARPRPETKPREVPRLARADVAGALGELAAFCRNGAFRIW